MTEPGTQVAEQRAAEEELFHRGGEDHGETDLDDPGAGVGPDQLGHDRVPGDLAAGRGRLGGLHPPDDLDQEAAEDAGAEEPGDDRPQVARDARLHLRPHALTAVEADPPEGLPGRDAADRGPHDDDEGRREEDRGLDGEVRDPEHGGGEYEEGGEGLELHRLVGGRSPEAGGGHAVLRDGEVGEEGEGEHGEGEDAEPHQDDPEAGRGEGEPLPGGRVSRGPGEGEAEPAHAVLEQAGLAGLDRSLPGEHRPEEAVDLEPRRGLGEPELLGLGEGAVEELDRPLPLAVGDEEDGDPPGGPGPHREVLEVREHGRVEGERDPAEDLELGARVEVDLLGAADRGDATGSEGRRHAGADGEPGEDAAREGGGRGGGDHGVSPYRDRGSPDHGDSARRGFPGRAGYPGGSSPRGPMSVVRSVLTYGLFPVTFVAMQLGAWSAYQAGTPVAWILLIVSASTVLIVAVAERVHPEFPDWNRSRGDMGTDFVHAIVSMLALPELLEIGIYTVFLGVGVSLAESFGGAIWPSSWPIVIQLAIALLISQFGEYWVHRLEHEVPLLWRLHATHHSPERLYWLNAARFHPLDTMLSFSAALIPLVLLGAGEEVLLLFTVWVAVHGLFQHCNVHMRLGPLNYVFSMAELHRWHHSLVLEEANANYGNNILFWDLVFGTVFWPRDRDASDEIGLADLPDFPKGYLGQILSPFRWSRIAGEPATDP